MHKYHVTRHSDDIIRLYLDGVVAATSLVKAPNLTPDTVYLASTGTAGADISKGEWGCSRFIDQVGGRLVLKPRKHPPTDLCTTAGVPGNPTDYIMLDAGDYICAGDIRVRAGAGAGTTITLSCGAARTLSDSYGLATSLELGGLVYLRRVGSAPTATTPENQLNIKCAMCDTRLTTPLPKHGCCPNHTRLARVLAGHERDPYYGNGSNEAMLAVGDTPVGKISTTSNAQSCKWYDAQVERNATFNRTIDRPIPHYDPCDVDDLLG